MIIKKIQFGIYGPLYRENYKKTDRQKENEKLIEKYFQNMKKIKNKNVTIKDKTN